MHIERKEEDREQDLHVGVQSLFVIIFSEFSFPSFFHPFLPSWRTYPSLGRLRTSSPGLSGAECPLLRR